MKRFLAFLLMSILAVGCNETKPDPPNLADSKQAEIKASLDKLPPDDRAIAEKQKYCPIAKGPLGSMGVPVKVMIKDQPVFLCCAHCEKKALEDPDKTLTTLEQFKTK